MTAPRPSRNVTTQRSGPRFPVARSQPPWRSRSTTKVNRVSVRVLGTATSSGETR